MHTPDTRRFGETPVAFSKPSCKWPVSTNVQDMSLSGSQLEFSDGIGSTHYCPSLSPYGARGSCCPATAGCRWRCRVAQAIPSCEESRPGASLANQPSAYLLLPRGGFISQVTEVSVRLSHPGWPLRSKGVTHLTYSGSLLRDKKSASLSQFISIACKASNDLLIYLHLHYRYPSDQANPTADELKLRLKTEVLKTTAT